MVRGVITSGTRVGLWNVNGVETPPMSSVTTLTVSQAIYAMVAGMCGTKFVTAIEPSSVHLGVAGCRCRISTKPVRCADESVFAQTASSCWYGYSRLTDLRTTAQLFARVAIELEDSLKMSSR